MRIIEVDVLQTAGVVAGVVPGAESGEVTQQAEVSTRDGAGDLQTCDMGVVAAHTADVMVFVVPGPVGCSSQAQLLGQRVGLVKSNSQDCVSCCKGRLGIDVVGILRPLGAIDLHYIARNKDDVV